MKPFVDRVLRDSDLTSGKHCLDVGCGYGDSSMMLGNYVGQTGSVSFVDNDSTTLEIAKKEFGTKVKFINSLFEKATLPTKYDNIVLTHVLEHIDNHLHQNIFLKNYLIYHK